MSHFQKNLNSAKAADDPYQGILTVTDFKMHYITSFSFNNTTSNCFNNGVKTEIQSEIS